MALARNEQRWIAGIGHRHEGCGFRIHQQIERTSVSSAEPDCAILRARTQWNGHVSACTESEC